MVTGTRRSASLPHWIAARGRSDAAGEPGIRAGRGASLVPPSSIAGRALAVIIAIMTFLGSLTVGGVDLVRTAAADWTSSIVREATIQVRPVTGRDVAADVARATEIAVRFPGVADVAPYTAEETRRMLEPWLGTGLGAEDLPIPRLIVVKLADDRRTDMEAFAGPSRGADREPRRPSPVVRPAARHGPRGDRRRPRHRRADDRGHRPLRGLRHARRGGDQPARGRGAAFRRRARCLHRRRVPAPFPLAGAEGRGRRRRAALAAIMASGSSRRAGARRPAATRSRRCSAPSRSDRPATGIAVLVLLVTGSPPSPAAGCGVGDRGGWHAASRRCARLRMRRVLHDAAGDATPEVRGCASRASGRTCRSQSALASRRRHSSRRW